MNISERIAKELQFFINNPLKRCRNQGGHMCTYSGVTVGVKTKGCLVGRMLPAHTRVALDKKYPKGASAQTIIDTELSNRRRAKTDPRFKDLRVNGFPKWMLNEEMGELLASVQTLHDSDRYWDENGFNNEGRASVKRKIENYGLDPKAFEDILKD